MTMDDRIDKLIKAKSKALETILPPGFPDKEVLWESLVARQAKHQARRTIVQWSIAASLLIAIGASYSLIVSNIHDAKDNVRITESGPSAANQKRAALDYIDQQCIISMNACNTPAVQELRSDLQTSFSQLSDIDKQLALFGDDPNLIRARTRIENHQSRLIKTLVQIL
jgi:hypothetical protein